MLVLFLVHVISGRGIPNTVQVMLTLSLSTAAMDGFRETDGGSVT